MLCEHSQVTLLAPVLSGGIFILVALSLAASGEASSSLWVVPTMVLILVVVSVFSRLTVTVSSSEVVAAFGLGWPRKTISFVDVIGAEKVRNRWWYGFGIRKVPKGWMYNVWGLDAVEFRLASGKLFRIGSDDCDRLLASVNLNRT